MSTQPVIQPNNPVQPITPFNNGQPLTPQQIKDFRTKMNVIPSAGNTSPDAQQNVASQWAKYDQARSGVSAGTDTSAKPAYETAMGIGDDEKGIIPESVEQIKKGFKQTQAGVNNPSLVGGAKDILAGTLNEVGGGLRGIFSPIEATLKAVSHLPGASQALDAIKEYVVNPIAGAISDIPAVQKFVENNPHAEENIGNAIAIATTLMGGEKAPEIKTAIENAPKDIANSKVGTAVSETGQNMKNAVVDKFTKSPEQEFGKDLNTAAKVIYKKLSPTEQEGVALKDTKTILGKKSEPDLVNDPKTKPVIEAVANLPEDIRLKETDTVAESESKLNQGISRLHQATDEYLAQPEVKASTMFNAKQYNNFMKKQVLDPIEKEFGIDSIEYREAQKAINTSFDTLSVKDVHGVHNGRQSFDAQFKSNNPRAFAKEKGSMGSQLDQKTNAVIDAGRSIRNAMNEFREHLLTKAELNKFDAFTPKEAQGLFDRAAQFDTKEDFVNQMKTEGSASGAEKKFTEKTGTPNEGTAKSTVSESGLNVNERASNAGGTHGKGYTTTVDEDLGEIWDMAHTEATPNNPIRARIREESNLIRAKEEMRARSTEDLGKNAVTRSIDRKPALKQTLRVGGGALKLGTGIDIAKHL